MGEIKIAIIDWVGRKAGMDDYDLSLLKAFHRSKVKTYLFSNFDYDQPGINIKNVFNINMKNRIFKGFSYFFSFIKSIIVCKVQKIDYIFLHLFSISYFLAITGFTAKISGLKIILISHDILSFAGDDRKLIKKIIYNFLPKLVIVHNKFSFNSLQKELGNRNKKNIHIIPQGNYLDFIKKIPRSRAIKSLGLSDKKKYILFFGQIKKVKGLDVLLKAVPKMESNVNLIIAGRPWKDDFSVYQRIINDLGIEDRIIKYIRYVDIHERDLFFNASSLLILPYTKIYQSAVQMFGMSYGIPVIASDLEPIKEIVSHNVSGFLFKTGDSGSLADCVNTNIINKTALKKVVNNSYKLMQSEFNWDKIADEYLKLLKQ